MYPIVILEAQGHLHFSLRERLRKHTDWNLGKLAPPPRGECSLACPWIVQSVDVLLTLLPFRLPFYVTSILLLGFPTSPPGGFMPQLSQSLRRNAMHLSHLFSVPGPS